jgi:hypothetical protein
MIGADSEFRLAANAAAAAWRAQPPYIAYRVDVNVDVPALKTSQVVSRAIEVRTRDDLAVLQDLPTGQNQVGHAFPVSPTFDALSYFQLDFHLGDPIRRHNPLTAVTMFQVLEYSDPVPSHPEVAVVATSLRNYYAHYADDSNDRIAHIIMEPLPALTTGNHSDFYLHDVYIDLQTNLPTRITYHGPTTDFELDYTEIEQHWLIDHAFYRRTFFGPLHIGQTSFTVDARYGMFTFPLVPNDVRLR